MESQNHEEWRSAAHKFKGASANLGAEKLSEACYAAESGFNEAEGVKSGMLDKIKIEYRLVQDFFRLRLSPLEGAS